MHNDIALTVDANCPVVLVLLDLMAAFAAVDHTFLLSHLNYAGIYSIIQHLKWFASYLSNNSSLCQSMACLLLVPLSGSFFFADVPQERA